MRSQYQAALDAMNAGADGLAHVFSDQVALSGFAKELAARNMFVIPTLTVLDSVFEPNGASLASDRDLRSYLTQPAITNLGRTGVAKYHFQKPMELAFAEATVRQLMSAGVPILAGTDSPNAGTWFGASLHRELELLVRSGMKPAQALVAATSVPARTFHLNDRGRIAPGLRADLILVNCDPTRNVLCTRKIVALWQAGESIDREKLKNTWNLPLD
jgi:imidazolonepropionase-like amidohydrolase